MKGQMGMMEYVVMVFFLAIVIVVLIFFLTGFQISQLNLEKRTIQLDRTLELSKQVMTSPLFVTENGVLDAAKLTALTAIPDVCDQLTGLFGEEWFFTVRVVGEPPAVCGVDTFPECTSWEICVQDKTMAAFDFPVNILFYEDLPRKELGLLTVGVYGE